LAISAIPLLLVGGALFLSGRRRRRRKSISSPISKPQGFFDGENPPDVIEASPGEVFSVQFFDVGDPIYQWSLSASPPDQSVKFIERRTESISDVSPEIVGGARTKIHFIFKAQKIGTGSIVFHNSQVIDGMEGVSPPSEIVEIKTIVSS